MNEAGRTGAEVEALVQAFLRVAELAGIAVPRECIDVEVLPAPHMPPGPLPTGKVAVYVFMWGSQCLKVGKVGARSRARYTTQHYSSRSSVSNLAASLLQHGLDIGVIGLSAGNVGYWIRDNTDRINVLVDASLGTSVLNLLESFLQCGLRPRFEGFER